MIDGITILAQETVIPPTVDIVVALVLSAVLAIMGIIGLIIGLIDRNIGVIILTIIILTCALILGIAGFSSAIQKPYTRYKVLIDQDVPWSTFYNNYEIIDQEGQIYTIKEK